MPWGPSGEWLVWSIQDRLLGEESLLPVRRGRGFAGRMKKRPWLGKDLEGGGEPAWNRGAACLCVCMYAGVCMHGLDKCVTVHVHVCACMYACIVCSRVGM